MSFIFICSLFSTTFFSLILQTVINVEITNTIAIIIPNLKYPSDLLDIPRAAIRISPKLLTEAPPSVAKILGITAILSLSLGSLVNDGIIDQYGISIIVYVIPHNIYATAQYT